MKNDKEHIKALIARHFEGTSSIDEDRNRTIISLPPAMENFGNTSLISMLWPTIGKTMLPTTLTIHCELPYPEWKAKRRRKQGGSGSPVGQQLPPQ